MRTNTAKILGTIGLLAGTLALGAIVIPGPTHADTPTPQPSQSTSDVASVILPGCEDITPVFAGGDFTGSCLMWDEGSWWLRVVDTDRIGDGVAYPTCPTEDSTSCVWDSASQGNGVGAGLILNP